MRWLAHHVWITSKRHIFIGLAWTLAWWTLFHWKSWVSIWCSNFIFCNTQLRACSAYFSLFLSHRWRIVTHMILWWWPFTLFLFRTSPIIIWRLTWCNPSSYLMYVARSNIIFLTNRTQLFIIIKELNIHNIFLMIIDHIIGNCRMIMTRCNIMVSETFLVFVVFMWHI